ncbi:MAG: MBL fold metallo-hydrolase [Candidatus Sericytochromatia bacterium]|nr:MBL fold metallo-hydrolase [Candidatus Tanganyikabacteria bacterium]
MSTARLLGKGAALSRGGMVVATSEGPIQFGAVPETIKDTMPTEGGVPAIYVIPDRMFSAQQGISLADLEFPIYFNFFARRRKTVCVCTAAQRRAIAAVMREAVFGPQKVDVRTEVAFGPVPDLSSEMAYFRKSPFSGQRMELDDMLEFVVFDNEDRACVGSVEIRRRRDNKFALRDQGKLLAEVPTDLNVPPPAEEVHGRVAPFHPPAFGITFIGTGHGFDPDTMTSGFIIWANHRGILVDPPVNSTEWLKTQEINPKLIDVVVLTHCHADHDGGTLQKILSEGRVRVYTTPTIMGSFVHKYRQLVGLERKRFETLFDFVPVSIGEPVRINGAEVLFHYTLHSVPCIGFEVYYGGKSLIYTSDTLYDPDLFDSLFEAAIIDEGERLIDRHGWISLGTSIRGTEQAEPGARRGSVRVAA